MASLRLDDLGVGGVLLDGRDALLQGREGVCKMAKILSKRFADKAEWKSYWEKLFFATKPRVAVTFEITG